MDICYHMKGGVTRHEAIMMSGLQRKQHISYISKILKEKAQAMTGQEFM